MREFHMKNIVLCGKDSPNAESLMFGLKILALFQGQTKRKRILFWTKSRAGNSNPALLLSSCESFSLLFLGGVLPRWQGHGVHRASGAFPPRRSTASCMTTITARMASRYTGSSAALMWAAMSPNRGGIRQIPT